MAPNVTATFLVAIVFVFTSVNVMSEQLERIKAIRRGNRAVITKYINEATNLLVNLENVNEATRERLNTLHNLLEEKLKLVKTFVNFLCC